MGGEESTGDAFQCVGTLEVMKPKQAGGFICGTLPVPTDHPFHDTALVPSAPHIKVVAPQYRLIPTETDLNHLPLLPNFPHKVFAGCNRDFQVESGQFSQNLARKCEALAVSGLAEYGNEIDVVAPADILKQIFKIPYSKARLSIAVYRIGQTLILNAGPDVEEGEKMHRRRKNQPKAMDHSLFLNFAMHSVRAEACDCPPQFKPSENASPNIFSGHSKSGEESYVSSSTTTDYDYSGGNHNNGTFWGSKQSERYDALKKTSEIDESCRAPVQEPEKHRRLCSDSFLRVLFWQFHNFRMLLGSDLLLFSNEKYTAVSLHLWDVGRQVTPLMWLEAWLDNVMASVPELAICYHRHGVVQGYELLKTEDVFLLKGISEDGTVAFHPQVVQQNGLSVLQFLQDNCKQDPGSYWLFKSAGEDMIQLFDLSVLPKTHASENDDKDCRSLPIFMNKAREDSLFSLGTLLYRLGHKLSLSKVHNNRTKCAKLFKKCLEFLNGRDHLVIRAYAHEQFARLILASYKELDLTMEPVLECGATVVDMQGETCELSSVASKFVIKDDELQSCNLNNLPSTEELGVLHLLTLDAPQKINSQANFHGVNTKKICSKAGDLAATTSSSSGIDSLALCHGSATQPLVQTIADPISSKMAVIHHVSQAIKSLRWKRQLQNAEGKANQGNEMPDGPSTAHQSSLCTCGDAYCIEVCDIREWLPSSKLDHKLWKLVLLLGESYLDLGESYKEDGQLHKTLKVIELACSIYGSMPPSLDDVPFVSSTSYNKTPCKGDNETRKETSKPSTSKMSSSSSGNDIPTIDHLCCKHLFWAKAWSLVGDVYVEYHQTKGKEALDPLGRRERQVELTVSTEVVKEVKRLKKKLGQFKQNCDMCSLINCSCQSDRASSGNSASSSSGDVPFVAHGRKHNRQSYIRIPSVASQEKHGTDCVPKQDMDSPVSVGSCPDKERDVCASSFSNSKKGDITHASSGSGSSEQVPSMKPTSLPAEQKTDIEPEIKEYGGIFTYLGGPKPGQVEHNLCAAIHCYDASCKAIVGLSSACHELESAVKKKGWVCNELGRYRLDNGDLRNAERSFADAIKVFREVSDTANIILIHCNLGHGRRALAEAMVAKMDDLRKYGLMGNAYKQAVDDAKFEYRESLKYYSAARVELDSCSEASVSEPTSLRKEVCTQYAHTYLRLGMLLAREDTSAEVYENGDIFYVLAGHSISGDGKTYGKELRKRVISANDAIREAVSIYESLGELRAQEAAFAYFQLACFQTDSCLKILDVEVARSAMKSRSSHLVKLKRYASLADRSWQKASDFYGPKSHSTMFMNILLERSNLASRLSSFVHPNMMLQSALSHLLEARHICVGEPNHANMEIDPSVDQKFFTQLQSLLKKMLSIAVAGSSSKLSDPGDSSHKAGDVKKLKEMYRLSLKATRIEQLNDIYELWTS